MEFLKDLFMLIGRVLIGSMFLWASFEKIKHWNASMARMHGKGVPHTHIILPVAIALKIIGGLSVFFGWHAHIGALLLLIVTIPSIFYFHAFWNAPESERKLERVFFKKEIAVIGGLFLILAMGAGRWALSGG